MQRLALLLALFSLAGAQAAFYAAPDGNDAGPGNAERPFATLARARDAVRALRQAGPLPEGPVFVYLKGGVHELAEPLARLQASWAQANILFHQGHLPQQPQLMAHR